MELHVAGGRSLAVFPMTQFKEWFCSTLLSVIWMLELIASSADLLTIVNQDVLLTVWTIRSGMKFNKHKCKCCIWDGMTTDTCTDGRQVAEEQLSRKGPEVLVAAVSTRVRNGACKPREKAAFWGVLNTV